MRNETMNLYFLPSYVKRCLTPLKTNLPPSIGRGDLKTKKANIFNALFELSSYIDTLNKETESLESLLYNQQGPSTINNAMVPITTTIVKVNDTHSTGTYISRIRL